MLACIQRTSTKFVKGIKHKFGEVWVWELGLFDLENRLSGDLITLYNYPEEGWNEVGVGLFFQLTRIGLEAALSCPMKSSD